jgi:hypothetical protein
MRRHQRRPGSANAQLKIDPSRPYGQDFPRRRLTALHNGTVPDADPFARLRLIGNRFDREGMPVETLVELAAYRVLIVGVAKELFRQAHPERQRVPRGFEARLQLRLKTIEEGSAMPVLEREVADGELLAAYDEFTSARDVIEHAVAAVADGQQLPDGFPRGALVLFNGFGQTLKPGEAVELRGGSAMGGPHYTPDVRRTLVLHSRRSVQQEVDDIGWVSEVDGDRMTCLIRLRTSPASTAVAAPLDELTFSAVKDVLEPRGEGPPVRVSGVGVFDADQRLIRFDAIHEVSVIEEAEELRRIDERIDEMTALKPGWLEGEGRQISALSIEKARRVLPDLLGRDVPRPRIFPTVGGGVQAEWILADTEVGVTFEADGAVYAIIVNLSTGEAEELDASVEALDRVAVILGLAQ